MLFDNSDFMVLDITNTKEWDELIKNEKISVVAFWAPWCPFCISLKPLFNSVSKDFENLNFARVNVDKQSNIATKYGVQNIPIIKFFCENKEIGEIIGYVPKNVLKEKIKENIKNTKSCMSKISLIKQHNK